MADIEEFREFAQRFAVVATGDFPDRVETMRGGLSLVRSVLPVSTANLRPNALVIASLLREEVMRCTNNEWTVVWLPPWVADVSTLNALHFGVVPVALVPPDSVIVEDELPDMREFVFRFESESGANCRFQPNTNTINRLPYAERGARLRKEHAIDMELRDKLGTYSRIALEVLFELISMAEANFGAQPEARRYADKLQSYVGYADAGENNDTVHGAMLLCIAMATFALEMNLSDVHKMIEERLPASS